MVASLLFAAMAQISVAQEVVDSAVMALTVFSETADQAAAAAR
jgi:hypothetical protein